MIHKRLNRDYQKLRMNVISFNLRGLGVGLEFRLQSQPDRHDSNLSFA